MTLPHCASTSASRAHQAWRDAWYSFRVLIWSNLEDPGWCWLSQALQIYRQEEPAVLDALQAEFEDLSWWKRWRAWNDRYEQLLPTSEDLRRIRLSSPLPSDLPSPPEEPDGLWTRTLELWTSENRMLAIGGGTIRTVLARGQAARTIRGE